LAAEAVKDLLNNVDNLDLNDIDAAFYSYFSDHLEQQLSMHWIIHDYIGLCGKPAYRVESGGATPIDAIINAYVFVKAGIFDKVLVCGWEKMSELNTAKVNEFIAMASDTDWDYPVGGYYSGYYAVLQTRHMHLFGETEEDLARLAVKNHNNASYNPYAQWRSQHGTEMISIDDVFKSRLIAWPYRVLNCAQISDGASAILIASEEEAKKLTDTPVWITGIGLGTDTMRPGDRLDNPAWIDQYPEDENIWLETEPRPESPYPEMANFGSFRVAADMAYKQTNIDNPLKQLDLAELLNPYDGVELCAYEDLRFCKRGEGKHLVREGVTEFDGDLPCQVSGGITAQGHAVGSTSIAQTVTVFWQLREEITQKWGAPSRQLSGAQRGLVQGHGGTGCQAGVIILER